MVDVWLPYGKTEVCARIPTRNFLGLIEPREKTGTADAIGEIRRALNEPIGCSKLAEMLKPYSKVAIVVDDATRPTLTQLMVGGVLEVLNQAGVPNENVTIIFACGTHRPVTQEEAVTLLGEQVFTRVRSVSHDCKAQDLVDVGTTAKTGNRVRVNRAYAEADVKVLTGDVSFHCYAGYGGGRKSILPGICGEETIRHNHALLLSANAKTGVLDGNPVHEDMVEAAELAKTDFVLNVVTNGKGELVRAFAGDLRQAFSEGVKLVDEMFRCTVDRRADIVVAGAGGNPADTSLFQAYKAVDSALEVVKRGGVIVLVAECPEGHGNQAFYDWMVKLGDLRAVEKEIKRHFVAGGHVAYYLLKALQNHQIILVSSMPDYYAANIFKVKTARAVNDALNMAFEIAGSSAKAWAMPYSNLTLPEIRVVEETVKLPEVAEAVGA